MYIFFSKRVSVFYLIILIISISNLYELKKYQVSFNFFFSQQHRKRLHRVAMTDRYETNLRVLKLHYPSITSILLSASYCCAYTFSPESQSWQKSGYEGPLFIVQSTYNDGLLHFGLLILNRLNVDNYWIEITADNDIDLVNGYVILRDDQDKISGLWLFEEADRESLCACVSECIERLEQENEALSYASYQMYNPPHSGTKVDLETLFASAANSSSSGQAGPMQGLPSADNMTRMFRMAIEARDAPF